MSNNSVVSSLAESMFNCSCFKLTGKCDEKNCISCSTKQQQNNVYEALSDIDKIRTQNEYNELLEVFKHNLISEVKEKIKQPTVVKKKSFWDELEYSLSGYLDGLKEGLLIIIGILGPMFLVFYVIYKMSN